jgi:hypothetical protein
MPPLLAWGFPYGGWCPPGRLAEDGRIPERYPLIELKEGGCRQRTLRNVLEELSLFSPDFSTKIQINQQLVDMFFTICIIVLIN